MLAPAALGTKYETRHTSKKKKKLGSPNRFSRSLIIIFSTKDFLTVAIFHPFQCTPNKVPLQTGVLVH
jgi:hypothetical protein